MGTTMRFLRICAVGLLLCLAPACTLFNGFDLEEPTAEVVLDGNLNSSSVGGRTVYWGRVRNTGDLDVEEVVFVVRVYGGGGVFLGQFSDLVSRGIEDEDPVSTLDAGGNSPGSGEAGDFIVYTSVPWGAAASTEWHVNFNIVPPEVQQ